MRKDERNGACSARAGDLQPGDSARANCKMQLADGSACSVHTYATYEMAPSLRYKRERRSKGSVRALSETAEESQARVAHPVTEYCNHIYPVRVSTYLDLSYLDGASAAGGGGAGAARAPVDGRRPNSKSARSNERETIINIYTSSRFVAKLRERYRLRTIRATALIPARPAGATSEGTPPLGAAGAPVVPARAAPSSHTYPYHN
ncbi:hypothetical protein EVAR_82278_1 [Eumeta japonica]|uniref:Uncharacterized protein n=1 Tax=Eumeta variegata TaxID=151549 RepID=A0A4C1VX49_EUMVA|nr:hypothetical protein EVAR_82278_1 [Eumeta japonica]